MADDDRMPPPPPQQQPQQPAQQTVQQPIYVYPPKKKSWAGRVATSLFIVLFVLSIVINIELIVLAAASSADGMEKVVLKTGSDDQTVAVYTVSGMIDDEAAANFNRFYQVIKEDANVKAVVLRVNSGGGGVAASDEIHHAVQRIQTNLKKPVIVSMGGVAASGGYYISASADSIIAEPTTVTGSIGVIAAWPVMKGMLDKVGVEMVTIRSADAEQWKARENFWEEPNAQTREEIRGLLNSMQQKFNSVVKTGRGDKLVLKQPAAAEAATQPAGPAPLNGKVYLADDAIAMGLVDKIGYLEDATAAAADTARLDNPRVVHYSKRLGLMEKAFGASDQRSMVATKLLDELSTPRIMMVWKVE